MASGGFFDDIDECEKSGASGPKQQSSAGVKGPDKRVQVFIKDRLEHDDNVNRSPEGNVVISSKFIEYGSKHLKQGSGALIPNMNHAWSTHPDLIENYQCGNVLYASRWIVTAAHCLVMDDILPFACCVQIPSRQKYAGSLSQGPGHKNAKKSKRFERLTFKLNEQNTFVFPEYLSSGAKGTDVALVRLPGPKVERLMYMPWSWPIGDIQDPSDVFISGYPAENDKSFIQYQSCSEWFNENGTELLHSEFGFKKFHKNGDLAMGKYTCQSTAGMSGGPVMLKHPDSGLYVRVGLHVQGGTMLNSCTMFTPAVVQWIREIQEQWDHVDS